MIAIKKLTGEDLVKFIESEAFDKLENIPISKHRAWSHFHNPHRDKGDVILYLAYMQDELVGYRTIMPGLLRGIDGSPVKVGWLSGNWVDPNKRRKGIASLLLESALSDWHSKLLYTNYAPISKAVYDKSDSFMVYKSYTGARFYPRSALSVILSGKNKIFMKMKLFLVFFDFVIDIFLAVPRRIIKLKYKPRDSRFEYLSFPDEDIFNYISEHNKEELEVRNGETFNWIVYYPWIISTPLQDPLNKKYNFSSTARTFNQWHVKIKGIKGHVKGYLLLSRKNAYFHVQYFYVEQDFINTAMKIIIQSALKCKCRVITVYNPELTKLLNWHLGSWLPGKKIYRKYIVTRELADKFLPHPDEKAFQDGAGDVVFV